MDLIYGVRYGAEWSHRTEGLATEVHIKSSEDDTYSLVCQLLYDLW